MTDVIAFVIALGFGFGLSLWIFSTFLEKSNNIGDSVGGRSAYKAYAKFTVRRDKMSNVDRDCFSILLAHIPNYERFAAFRTDLTICADTHGGMVQLPF